MTKAELEEKLQQSVNFGNIMAEFLEIMRNDEVISAYRQVLREHSNPFLWMETPGDPLDPLLGDEGEWDCFVGDLQRAGVVDKDLMSDVAAGRVAVDVEMVDKKEDPAVG